MTHNDLEGKKDKKYSVSTLFCVYGWEWVWTQLVIPVSTSPAKLLLKIEGEGVWGPIF